MRRLITTLALVAVLLVASPSYSYGQETSTLQSQITELQVLIQKLKASLGSVTQSLSVIVPMNYLGLKARGITGGITLVEKNGVVCTQTVLDS